MFIDNLNHYLTLTFNLNTEDEFDSLISVANAKEISITGFHIDGTFNSKKSVFMFTSIESTLNLLNSNFIDIEMNFKKFILISDCSALIVI